MNPEEEPRLFCSIAGAERVYLEDGSGGGVDEGIEKDRERNSTGTGRVDLGKGQRHLPTPSYCHPSNHRSHIKLKDRL